MNFEEFTALLATLDGMTDKAFYAFLVWMFFKEVVPLTLAILLAVFTWRRRAAIKNLFRGNREEIAKLFRLDDPK